MLSPAYDAWLDAVHAENIELHSERDLAVPMLSFFQTSIDAGAISGVGSLLHNGPYLAPDERTEQYHNSLHQWLRDASPRLWHGQDSHPEKDALLARAAAQASGEAATFDEDQLATTFKRLLADRGIEGSTGANDADFVRFAEATGFEMPEQLKTVLRIANGCYLGAAYCDLMTVDKIISTWEIDNAQFESSTLDDLTTYSKSADDRTLAIESTPLWIPITDERSPNKAGIDLCPGPTGKLGRHVTVRAGAAPIIASVTSGSPGPETTCVNHNLNI